MAFSKENIRYEYDVFSKSRQVLILWFRLNILAATYMYIHTYHFVLGVLFIQLKNKMVCVSKNQLINITGLSNGAVTTDNSTGKISIFL